jgi:hypothetical protein
MFIIANNEEENRVKVRVFRLYTKGKCIRQDVQTCQKESFVATIARKSPEKYWTD